MWHDGQGESVKFWLLFGIAASIVIVLSVKSALTWFLQKRRAERDEHETSGHSA